MLILAALLVLILVGWIILGSMVLPPS